MVRPGPHYSVQDVANGWVKGLAEAGCEVADFNFLLNTLGLTKGNLSAHTSKLEEAGYIEISKRFNGKIPNTTYRLARLGRERLAEYWRVIDEIRESAGATSER